MWPLQAERELPGSVVCVYARVFRERRMVTDLNEGHQRAVLSFTHRVGRLWVVLYSRLRWWWLGLNCEGLQRHSLSRRRIRRAWRGILPVCHFLS